MRVTLIFNPVSGGGTGRAAAERCAAAFRAAGHEPRLHAWEPAGPGAAELARAAADDGADRVVAIGGDGTALHVAEGLLAASRAVPMAHLPRGTGNALGTNLGIPRRLDGAIAVAVGGVEGRIDVGLLRATRPDGGEAAEVPFVLSAGTGLHAEIIARADRHAKRRWGLAAYAWAGWSALATPAPARYRVIVDGAAEELEGTMIQVVNSGALFHPAWMIGPGISPVDGELDVLAYRARSRAQYLKLAARFLRGAPTGTALVRHLRGRRVRIEADREVGVQRDGEPAGVLPAELNVRPGALPVVVPAGSRLAA